MATKKTPMKPAPLPKKAPKGIPAMQRAGKGMTGNVKPGRPC